MSGRALTASQTIELKDLINSHPLLLSEGVSIAIQLALATGLSSRDVASLRWSNVNWLRNHIEVSPGRLSLYTLNLRKEKDSITFPISRELFSCLLREVDRQHNFKPAGFVVQDSEGDPWPADGLALMVRCALRRLFGDGYSMSSLRATHRAGGAL